MFQSLSSKLLILTVSFVMLAEVLMLRDETAPTITTSYDLRSTSWLELIVDAMSLIADGPNGVIEVTGEAIEGGGRICRHHGR